MKKMLSAILVLTLMIGVMAVTASAAGAGTVQFDPNVNEAQPGDTITVKLNVVSNPGVMFFSYTPIYDTARLELVSMAGKDSSWTCATKANWDGANDEAFTGNVVILTFKVKDGAVPGTADVGGSIEAYNHDEEEITFDVTPGIVTIKAGPHSHDWGTGTVTKEATCEEAGIRTYTCSICGETKTEEIAALGHEWDEGTVTKEATCKEAGVKTYTCKRDSKHTKTEEIAKLEHESDEGTVTKEATCTEAGEKTYKCKLCGEVLKTEEIPALGHDMSEATVTKEATCTEAGEKTAKCSRCGETVTEEIPALGHDMSEATVTKEPTCTEAGEKTAKCSRCGETVTEEIPALGHDWDEGTVTKEPTCTEAGEKTIKCKNCDETKTEEIAALGHDWDEGKVTKEPTTTQPGEKVYTCKRDNNHTKTEILPATVTPKTGDTSIALWVTLFCLSAIGVGAIVLVSNKKKARG